MEPEDRDLLRRTFELSQKNSKILESIKKSMFWGRVMRYVYWAILLGAAVGAYYFIEPYVDQMLEVYGGVKGSINNLFQ
ncbi:MAG TPA: hypothetical protein VJH67_00755 [Candidatus Paceibacterota bacterium]